MNPALSPSSSRILLLVLVLTVVLTAPAFAGGDWNDSGIAWKGYEEGLAAARAEGKPVCLIIYTEWCPHCTNYSSVFHTPKVVEMAKNFVMIRLEQDQNRELAARYNVDGSYIPRTYFLTASGTVDENLHAPRPQYRFFYDEHDPASILAGMEKALGKLR